jgi:hypothetical protein
MVGKRERDCKNPVRRTTSMTEFALAAVMEEDDEEAQLPDNGSSSSRGGGQHQQDWLSALGGGAAAAQEDWIAAYRARAAPAKAGLRRNSADYSAVETAAFLRACGLCRRRLGPGRDTFVYKYVFAHLRAILVLNLRLRVLKLLFFSSIPPAHLYGWLIGYTCMQGRGGVLQPGVQGAAHHAGGVEGQVRGDVDQGRGCGEGRQRPPPRRRRQGRGHGGRGMTRHTPTRRLHLHLLPASPRPGSCNCKLIIDRSLVHNHIYI